MGSKRTSYRTVVTIYKPTQVIGLTQKGMVKRIVILLSLLRTKAVVPIVKASKSNPAERKTLKLATNGNQERSNSTCSLTKVDFVQQSLRRKTR